MNYWLLKSDPDTYAWDAMVKEKQTSWNGVRNNQAALNLKAMKKGDHAFFYHSGPGAEIVGLVEITRAAYPDPTDKAGRFVMVDIKALRAVKTPVSLTAIKAETSLANLALVKQSRLSVVSIGAAEWKTLCKMAGVPA
jgi:predicted RNA-binding protein with PUA-like domain